MTGAMAEATRYTAAEEDLAVQELGDELLIYDRVGDVAHCLTWPAARVWRACEGEGATLDELTDALLAEGTGELSTREHAAAIAERALTELQEKRLLTKPSGGVSRRDVLLKLGAVGTGALAAPLVISAAVPSSAEAFKSPTTCVAIGGSCTAAPGQVNSYGSSSMNSCCRPGVKSCSLAVGSGTGGCHCNSSGVCANCTASGSQPPTTCGDGRCVSVPNSTNRCCCSGVCAAAVKGNVCA